MGWVGEGHGRTPFEEVGKGSPRVATSSVFPALAPRTLQVRPSVWSPELQRVDKQAWK